MNEWSKGRRPNDAGTNAESKIALWMSTKSAALVAGVFFLAGCSVGALFLFLSWKVSHVRQASFIEYLYWAPLPGFTVAVVGLILRRSARH